MTRSLPAIGLAVALALPPALAAAEPLDRIAEANIALSRQMESFFLARAPELEGKMPDYDWNAEMRSAGACFVEGYEREAGAEALEDYIRALEAWSGTEITSFQQLTFGMPEILTAPLPMRLTEDCGVMEISLARATESGFIEALSDPAIMAKVIGE